MDFEAGTASERPLRDAFQADRPLSDLLAELRAGKPAPGSGSANALMAAVAASSLSSVAKKTVEHGFEFAYRSVNQPAMDTDKRCQKIVAELLELMERDAYAFAPVVGYRRERKTIRDEFSNDESIRKEIEAMKPATIIPMRVGELSIEVAGRALVLLKSGFKGARGESYSALMGSLSSAESSLYLARFNLKILAARHDEVDAPKDERVWWKEAAAAVAELTGRLRTVFADYLRYGRRDELTSRKKKAGRSSRPRSRAPRG